MDEHPGPAQREVTAGGAGRAFTVLPRGEADEVFWTLFADGGFEPETLAVLGAELGPGDALLDIGAWIGPMTLAAAAAGAAVVAVEADPVAVAALTANVAANPELAPAVTVVAAAAVPREGPVRVDGGDGGLGRGISRASAAARWPVARWPAARWPVARSRRHDPEGAATVDGVALSQLWRLGPGGGFTVVKLDIEGGEYPLAAALRRLLRGPGRPPVLLLSLHGPAGAGLTPGRRLLLRLRLAPRRLRLLWALRPYRSVCRIDSHRRRGSTPLGLLDRVVLAFRLGEAELLCRPEPAGDQPSGPAASGPGTT
ncbi:MAG: FkbM family methyltransferase [Acidimicrobiia bacterium]